MPLVLLFVVWLFGWRIIRAMTIGVNVSVLGARGSGKTTLIRQLRGEGWDPDEPSTNVSDEYEKIKFWRGPIRVVLHHLPDISGGFTGTDVWAQWRRSASDRDVILYLIDARVLLATSEGMGGSNTSLWRRAVRDADQMRLWREESEAGGPGFKRRSPVYFVIVTHRDEDPRYDKEPDVYLDTITQQLTEIIVRLGREKTIVRSADLRDGDEVQDMVASIAKEYRTRRYR